MSQNENNVSDLKPFSYFISHRGSILVTSLSGLCESEALDLLKQCKSEMEELLTDSVQGVVINFSGVTSIANDLVPFWAQLQSMIRSRQIELRLCGIEKSLQVKLGRMGILRGSETVQSLKEALPDIIGTLKMRSHSSQPKKIA